MSGSGLQTPVSNNILVGARFGIKTRMNIPVKGNVIWKTWARHSLESVTDKKDCCKFGEDTHTIYTACISKKSLTTERQNADMFL